MSEGRALVRKLAAAWGRSGRPTPDADGLTSRLAAAEAAVRAADQRFVDLAVHSTERTNALEARMVDAEARLASLEIDVALTREAIVHGLDARPPSVPAQVEYWRRRVGAPVPVAGPATRAADAGVARVATDVGPLLIPARDEVMLTYLRQHGRWEPEESDQLRALLRPGGVVVDVGAHVGYMSLLAAGVVGPAGRVYAFEPEPRNFQLLMANLLTHGAANVEPVNAAAWRESTRLSLSVCEDNTGDHRVYAVPGRDSVDVLAVAVDEVLPDDARVDVVKVDAQGTDDVAVRGMERTLARCRPAVVVEFWPDGIRERGDAPRDVLDYYRSLDYELSVVGDRGTGGGPASPDDVIEAAESDPTRFCTVLLTPAR